MAVTVPKSAAGEASSGQGVPGITRPMTYEEYLAGPEEMARYDIVDGWKDYRLYGVTQLANPTRDHQRILGRLLRAFQDYEAETKRGEVIAAPCDVRISYEPLRSYQPELLFISNERLAENPPSDNPAPLAPAPEIVVEIASPSDKPEVMAAKIADYRTADVHEVWVIRPATRTIEIVPLSVEKIGPLVEYGSGDTASSSVFPGLSIAVDMIFEAL